ncbi:TetR/AcrR family transcriptional regulator [Nocardioides dongkuii]|uniref:TetR/AcrR family transcriptional regulator n=1 Tax=Nocardioides dongkuii TaxID=2760089 RepID=UPI0015FC72BF|nr:TetR/AcrR family transcriptional regulator [Nocardioides dongkuii]
MAEDRRGRPRSKHSEQAVMTAVQALLLEGGYERLSIEAVAARAGVGKQTIYRWWPSKSALVADAVLDGWIGGEVIPLAETEDLRLDLTNWLVAFAEALSDEPTAALVRALVAASVEREDSSLRLWEQFAGPQHDAVVKRLNAATRAGDLRPDIDVAAVADALIGAPLYHLLSRQRPQFATRARGLLDVVLAGVAAGSPPH